MIIHISGMTGSGKTTLGHKIKEYDDDIVVIDTDDIDDFNVNNMLENKKYNKYLTMKNINNFYKLKNKLNEKQMIKIVNDCKKKNKILVIVGHTFNDGIADPEKYADYKYFINAKYQDNYNQYLQRTYNNIAINRRSIKSMLKKETNVYKIDLLLIFKYKIRPSPPYPGFYHNAKAMKKYAQKDKYKVMSSENIYNNIIKKIDRYRSE